ncbi:MAG: LPS export ABC transporter permease LptG [Pseudomonadales bacterium]
MKRLDLYLGGTVGMMIIMASLGLVGILGIFTFLEQVEDMRNNYTTAKVLLYVLQSVPRMFYETLPYAALIGCLAGLGVLANNSELVVMRAAGVSTWSIAFSAMKPALLLVLFGLYVGEFILPDVERSARVNRERAMSVEESFSPQRGVWYREGNVFMRFELIQGGVIDGVTHYYYDDNRQLTRSMYAARAVFHDVSESNRYWLMENVTLTEFDEVREARVSQKTSLRWDTGLEPQLLNAEQLVQPDKMSITELDNKISYMKAQGLNSAKFELGYWRKMLQPVATLALVFVAISFIFGPLREATMGMRVVSGLVIGIVFKFVQDLLAPASIVFGFSPVIATVIPIGICLIAGFFLLRRAG